MVTEAVALALAVLEALTGALAGNKTLEEIVPIAENAAKALAAFMSTQGPVTQAQLESFRVKVPWKSPTPEVTASATTTPETPTQ